MFTFFNFNDYCASTQAYRKEKYWLDMPMSGVMVYAGNEVGVLVLMATSFLYKVKEANVFKVRPRVHAPVGVHSFNLHLHDTYHFQGVAVASNVAPGCTVKGAFICICVPRRINPAPP
jgi:hypothetical protein